MLSAEDPTPPTGAPSKGPQVDFLPSLAPVSPLSSSPYFEPGFASLSAASPPSSTTRQPPPRLHLPPLHLDSFKEMSPTQLEYRRSPASSPQISPGLASPEGRALVQDASSSGPSGQRLSPVTTTPHSGDSFAAASSSSSHNKPSPIQLPVPPSATSDQFLLDPTSRGSSSSHSAEQRPLGRKGTVGLSLVKASNEARASSSGAQKEVMRGLGFVEAAETTPEESTNTPPGTATSGAFEPPRTVRRSSTSSHPASPPPPSPSGPPPPVPALPHKSPRRPSGASSPAPQSSTVSPRTSRPSTNSRKSSTSSLSSGPSSRRAGASSAGIGGLTLPPLPVPPSLSTLPRSDSGVLDPRLLNGALVEKSPPPEVLQDEAAEAPVTAKEGDEQVNFAGIGSRHLFSPQQPEATEVATPSAGNRTSSYSASPSLGPSASQRRALPHPPQSSPLPNHPPPPLPPQSYAPQPAAQRGSYPPQAQVASPPSVSKRLVDTNARYQAGPQTGAVADDPYEAARRSLDPQTFQGMVGQVGQTATGPEVCLECMMRDRDLIHVDVTSPGIWARHSDSDLHDLAAREADGEDITAHLAGGVTWEGGGPIGMGKVPGLKVKGRRSIKGDRLTEAALKEWTMKSPPAATHRFQTLQKYLISQLQLIAELAGGPVPSLAGASSEVENRILRSKIQNTFAPLRRDEHVTLKPTEAARMRAAKGRPGPDPDSMIEVENYDGKPSFDAVRVRRKSVDLELQSKQSRLSVVDGVGPSPQLPGPTHGVRSSTMPTPIPSSASAVNFPPLRSPHDDGDFRSASAASFNNLPLPVPRGGEPVSVPDGKPVRPFSFAMWAGRARSNSNASQDGSRGGIFKGRFGMPSGRSETSDMTGAGGSAWAGSGSMMNMHVALDRDKDKQNRPGFAFPYQQNASTDALNQRWRADADGGRSFSASATGYYSQKCPGSAPQSPARASGASGHPDGKKKKGFKAFFSKLGGGSVKSSSSFGNSPQMANSPFGGATPSQGYPSPMPGEGDDFAPLDPPPSLKFLSRGKTPSTPSLHSLASGPNSPRAPVPGNNRSRAGSLSGSSVFSNPAMIAPPLSSGQSYSSSQHPRSVSTPVGPPGPQQHGKAPSLSSSLATSVNSMSPASGTFPMRRGSRDTLGSRKSMFTGPDGIDGPMASPGLMRSRASPGDSLAKEAILAGNDYFPPGGDLYQRRSIASINGGSQGRFSSAPGPAHRLSVASGPPQPHPQGVPPFPTPVAHRRQSSNFQKDLPPLPPPSPSMANEPSDGYPLRTSFSANPHARPPEGRQDANNPDRTVRNNITDKSHKEKKRGKISGFFGVGSRKTEAVEPPRSSSRNEGGLIGYRYSSHERQ